MSIRLNTYPTLFAFFLVFSVFTLSANDLHALEKPRVSIIASVHESDDFIRGFLEDTTRQTIFPQSELIIINANSSGNEEGIIFEYTAKYPNIKYQRLDSDPGLYGVYNYAISLASADLIANADIDDRRNPEFLEKQVEMLESNPGIDLVYSEYLITNNPNETWENNQYRYKVKMPDYLPSLMNFCLPGPQPVWRKQMHEKYGLFDESFRFSGDWEFWCRASAKGANFKRIDGLSGLHYNNPKGLRSAKQKAEFVQKETDLITKIYSSKWAGFKKKEAQNLTFYSKFGQDRYIFENFFSDLKNGVFVDIGAKDGIADSNTFFFEKEMGWNGLCIETQPKTFQLLKLMRTCKAENVGLAVNDGTMEFISINLPDSQENLNGFAQNFSANKLEDLKAFIKNAGGSIDQVKIPAKRLDSILSENGINHIHYLSLNMPTSQLEVLQMIDFNATNIDVISCGNQQKSPVLTQFLESQGFHYMTTLGSDDIYVNSAFAG